jgi:hypothetical protein
MLHHLPNRSHFALRRDVMNTITFAILCSFAPRLFSSEVGIPNGSAHLRQ